jgi:hypothetical protein
VVARKCLRNECVNPECRLEYITEHKKADWNIYHSKDFKLDGGVEFPEWMINLASVASRQKKEDSDVLRSALEAIRKEGLDTVTEKSKPDASENDAAQSKLVVADEAENA